ncbi:UBX domain-containing protein [Histoplasma capsulatum H143]|uniref:UBX domain-containing protein n=1 Tax=Ajellomyces capsulatus (strain H143) TaxID=544712 RepID=C6H8T5_AJECH|nr:UBX domain-containing protein [Histoplasma capsulatum H143]
MASHVVVIDSTARKATVKVTPTKHLTEVLSEACSKLGLDARQYGLKHQKKQIDLSLSIRLSGLSSGARLELVQLSRSPSVVSVALQLPESEARGAPNGRLTDKFPSNTTLWHVLRKFEAGVAGNGTTRNLTARGVPSTPTGAGRLFYESPVIQVVGRELSSFGDLQRTLGQLGFNSGSTLLRLNFRATDKPLEEAMMEIAGYFQSIEEEEDKSNVNAAESSKRETLIPSNSEQAMPESSATSTPSDITDPTPERQAIPEQQQSTENPAQTPPPATTVSSRPTTVYAPPSSAVPQSAQTPFNEHDYVPTVDQAKAHQLYLSRTTRPNRLPTDAELAAQASAQETKLASIADVEVKIRFPDQSQVVSKFTREDTAQGLYAFVRSCLDSSISGEKFSLSFFAAAGGVGAGGAASPLTTSLHTHHSLSSNPTNKKGQYVIPDVVEKLLIRDLRMSGRVLVNFSWADDVSSRAKSASTRVQILRPELRQVASQIKVQEVAALPVRDEKGDKSLLQRLGGGGDGDQGRAGARKGGGGVPKWLKLPGKK